MQHIYAYKILKDIYQKSVFEEYSYVSNNNVSVSEKELDILELKFNEAKKILNYIELFGKSNFDIVMNAILKLNKLYLLDNQFDKFIYHITVPFDKSRNGYYYFKDKDPEVLSLFKEQDNEYSSVLHKNKLELFLYTINEEIKTLTFFLNIKRLGYIYSELIKEPKKDYQLLLKESLNIIEFDYDDYYDYHIKTSIEESLKSFNPKTGEGLISADVVFERLRKMTNDTKEEYNIEKELEDKNLIFK